MESDVGFLLELDLSNLLTSGHHVLVLDTHFTTTPGSAEFDVVVELGHEDLGEFFEILVVFLVDFGEGEAGSGLLVDELTEVCLSSDEAEGNILLSAESGEEADHFDGVNIVSDNDELGLVLFDESGNVVETVFDVERLGSLGLVTLGGGISGQSSLLLSARFRAVLGEELEELAGFVSLNSGLELSNCWWDLQALHENSLLSLNSDVLGPLDETGEVSLGLDVTSNSEVAGVLLEQGLLFA